MRAATGAIERVEMIKGQIKTSVIGGGKASGICGSGVVDLVAVLLREGILDASGRMSDRDSFVRQYPYSSLAERLVSRGKCQFSSSYLFRKKAIGKRVFF